MKILISSIKVPENLMRQSMSERGLEHLAQSMTAVGLMHPIGVRAENDHYVLVHGHRRLSAAKLLEWAEIEADLMDISDDIVEMIKVMENREREDVNPIEEGMFYKALLQEKGWTQTYLAEILNVSNGFISQRIGSKDWPKTLRDAVIVGALSFTTAREISGIKDYEHLLYVAHHAAKSGATPSVAREWRRRANLDYAEKLRRAEGVETEADARAAQEPEMNCHTCGNQGKVSEIRTYSMCAKCQALIEEVRRQGLFKENYATVGATGEGGVEQAGLERDGEGKE